MISMIGATPKRFVTVRNVTRDRELGDRIVMADTFWPRLRGLIGRKPLEPGEGLLLSPCRAVHTFGMTDRVDVVMIGADFEVIALYPEFGARGRTRWHRTAAHVLELPPGTIAASGTQVRDRLAWDVLLAEAKSRAGRDAASRAARVAPAGAFRSGHSTSTLTPAPEGGPHESNE